MIGRRTDNDIILENRQVSRRHAEIRVTKEGLQLKDLNSSNGTHVNGHPVFSWTMIEEGDEICFGTYSFQLLTRETGGMPLPRAPGGTTDNTSETNFQPAMFDLGGRWLSLVKSRVTIGSSRDCDITLNDASIAPLHARMTFSNHVWTLENIHSSKGTRKNGHRIERCTKRRRCHFIRQIQVSFALSGIVPQK